MSLLFIFYVQGNLWEDFPQPNLEFASCYACTDPDRLCLRSRADYRPEPLGRERCGRSLARRAALLRRNWIKGNVCRRAPGVGARPVCPPCCSSRFEFESTGLAVPLSQSPVELKQRYHLTAGWRGTSANQNARAVTRQEVPPPARGHHLLSGGTRAKAL
ncbi:hypothetical protein GJAV_G00260430 [Gymnothorax javanicus]|nr:hypothetical protein GJAV_G00260430 [Gymnothorax javanicus]